MNNKASFAYIRVSAVALAAAFVMMRGGARVGAQSGVTITSPASGAVLAAGPDFATDTWSDPWDFANREDVAIDPAQIAGFSNFTVSGGQAGGTVSSSGGANFSLLQRAWYNVVNPGRTGRTSPIDSSTYTKLAFKMSSTRGDQYPRVYWFHNDIGNPSGDASGWRYLTASPAPSGSNIFVVDLTQSGQGTAWTSGAVKGLAMYPSSSASGYDAKFDWVRLTTGDGSSSSKIVPVTWSGGSGTATIQVRDAAGSVFTVASGLSGTSYNWNYGVLPPGTYTLTVVRGGVASAARTFRINTPPTLHVTDPDASGGDDFATTVLGDPWDMRDSADVKADGTIVDHVISRSFSGGQYTATSDSTIVGYAGSTPMGDPQMYLLSNSSASNTTDVIDTTRYHRLTYSLQVDQPFNLGTGSVARVFWGASTGSGAPYTNVTATKDIITWPGMNTYTIDLATLSSATDGGLEPGGVGAWTAAKMRHLRIDPFETHGQYTFHFGTVKLAADDETKNGSFTIRFSGSDADGDATTVALYYDKDRNPANGMTQIASGIPIANGQYVWNAGSVPQGTYYIYAVANDGRNAVGSYSTGPVRVSGFVSSDSDPRLSVDVPGNGATVTAAFEIAGWATDLGAGSGTGVDGMQYYIYPNDGASPAVYLGSGSYGATRGDIASLYGAQFTNSGYHFTVTGMTPGRYLLAVYAHSNVSNSYVLKTAHITVNANTLESIDVPSPEASVASGPFAVGGWAIDRRSGSGAGVDLVHVYAYPNPTASPAPAPIFLGQASLGISRPDVAATYGSQYQNSGYVLNLNTVSAGLKPGLYNIAVWARSTVDGSFNNVAVVRITIR